MKKFFWDIFVKSGSIDAFLGFKEFEAANRCAENGLKAEGLKGGCGL